MDIREIVQRNIAYYIKQSDYTQADLARMLEVSKTTVTNWVKGVILRTSSIMEPQPERMKSPSTILT